MYSEPLSAWKPWMTKGNVARSSSSIGIRKRSLMRSTENTHWNWVTSSTAKTAKLSLLLVDMVNPFDAVQIALVNRVNTQKARLTLRVGLAPFTDRDAFRACLVEMAALTLVAVGVA